MTTLNTSDPVLGLDSSDRRHEDLSESPHRRLGDRWLNQAIGALAIVLWALLGFSVFIYLILHSSS